MEPELDAVYGRLAALRSGRPFGLLGAGLLLLHLP
jgi:hypothetical protein